MNEFWKPVVGYEGYYEVSNLGKVRSLIFGKHKILKQYPDKDNYLTIRLVKDKKQKYYSVHRLVAQAFIPNTNNYPVVNHKNEIKVDNRVENLEWCTVKYNNNYGTRYKTSNKKTPIVQLSKDGVIIKKWDKIINASITLGINQGSIVRCCKGKLKSTGGYIWRYHYKSLWLKNHIPLINQKK